MLLRDVSRADSTGKATSAAELDQVGAYTRFVVRTKATRNSATLYSTESVVTR